MHYMKTSGGDRGSFKKHMGTRREWRVEGFGFRALGPNKEFSGSRSAGPGAWFKAYLRTSRLGPPQKHSNLPRSHLPGVVASRHIRTLGSGGWGGSAGIWSFYRPASPRPPHESRAKCHSLR